MPSDSRRIRMDPTPLSKEMKKFFRPFLQKKRSEYFVTKVQALEDENKKLKLRILEFEKKEANGFNNICGCVKREEDQKHVTSGMSGPIIIMSTSFGGVGYPLDETHMEEEPLDEFVPVNLRTVTPPIIDEDIVIDIKEEDVGFLLSQSESDMVISNIHTVILDRPNEVPISNHETSREVVSTEVETDLNLNQNSSSDLPRNVVCQKSVKPQQQVSSQRLGRQKERNLTTRTSEKIHNCETCSMSFDNQFELTEHKKSSHTGEKEILANIKTSFNCSVCEKNFSTKTILTDHLRTHTGEKKMRTSLRTPFKCYDCGKSYKTEKLLTDHMRTIHTKSLRSGKRFSVNCKRSLHVEKEDEQGLMEMG